MSAHQHDAGPRREVRAQLRGARDDVLAVGDLARQQIGDEGLDCGLTRLVGTASALDLERDQGADHSDECDGRRLATRLVVQAADLGVGETQGHDLRALLAAEHGAFVVGRSACDREHRRGGVDDCDPRRQCARARACDLRQARPRLDGLRHLGHGLEHALAGSRLRALAWRR